MNFDYVKAAQIAVIIIEKQIEQNARLMELLDLLESTDELPQENLDELRSLRQQAVASFNEAYNDRF